MPSEADAIIEASLKSRPGGDLVFSYADAVHFVKAALEADKAPLECPPEYQGEGGFFVYDFMPQKIMFKVKKHGYSQALDVLNVRGWGYLTGGGALGLPEDVAAKIQDGFGKWVAETLNAALVQKQND